MFENFGWVSAGTFGVRKTFVESYLDWAVKCGKVEYRNLENLTIDEIKEIIRDQNLLELLEKLENEDQ